MTSRERVALALAHKEADRAPVDYWGTSEITGKLLKHFGFSDTEQLLNHFDVDFRYIDGPRYIGPEPAVRADGTVEDHFGVPRARVSVGAGENAGAYMEAVSFPLADARAIEDLRNYSKWPSPDWFDYSVVREQVGAARATSKVVVFMGDRLNRCAQLKPAMYLRGIEQILLDLIEQPEFAEYIFARLTEFYVEYARRTFEAAGGGVDVFMTGDDFGTQRGLFMSPEMWRRFLRPGFRAFMDLGKRYGCKVAHHSCGSIQPLIPELIECGLDILNPIQPEARNMSCAVLKRLFGDRLSFHGSISIQRTMPFGTPEEIRQEVRDAFPEPGAWRRLHLLHRAQHPV